MSIRLAHQTQKTAGIGNGLRTAVVTAVDTTGITLSINGATVGPFACLDTILPVVGDTVSVFRQDSTWIIIGRPTLTPSPWVRPSLLNGWSGTFAVRLVRGAGLSMQVAAEMTAGTKTDGTIITTLSAPYIPKTSFDVPAAAGTLVSGGQAPHLLFQNSGNVICQGFASSSFGALQAIIALDL